METREVLLVGNEQDSAFWKQMCEEYSYTHAATCAAACTVLRRRALLILFLDIDLLDQAQALLRALHNNGTQFVVLTRQFNAADQECAFAQGAADVLCRADGKLALRRRMENILRSAVYALDSWRDTLTGVYQKTAFYDRVCAVLHGRDAGARPTIVCVDIERFKVINDLYGAAAGDRMLQFIGALLQEQVKAYKGFAGRVVADVFALYLPDLQEPEQVLAQKLTDEISAYPIDMTIVPVYGFYYIDDVQLPVSNMCDRAILALNTVKGNYHVHFAVYNDTMRERILLEQQIIDDMAPAIENEEFVLYFQPKCEISTGRVVGSEALVRWQHPQRGLLAPGEFIPIFEKNGFVISLDHYVWEHACRYLREWIEKGSRPIPVSVNVSQINLYHPRLCETLISLVERYDIAPALLQLEITESACVADVQHLQQVIATLRNYGFTILMDDFGSGYSSLNTLQELDVDVLKIDMRFLKEAANSNKGSNILESVVRMAKWLNLGVIAEGVETKQQAEFLLDIGCNYAQGYYFHKPMPRAQFEALLDGGQVDYEARLQASGDTIDFHDLFHTNEMSDRILNNLIGGVAVYEYFNGNLEVLRVNDGYYRITGCSRESLRKRGRHVLRYIPEQDRPLVTEALESAAAHPGEGMEARFRRIQPDGSMMWMHLRVFFLAENGGRRLFYASINDITEQMRAVEKLRVSEQQLHMVLEAADLLLFSYDVDTHTTTYSAQYARRYNLPQRLENTPDCLVEKGAIHPDDASAFLEMYRAIYAGQASAFCEVRVRAPQGDYRWNRITVCTVFNADGASTRAVGIAEDITHAKILEQRIRQGQRTLEQLKAENQRTALSLMAQTMPGGLLGGYMEPGFPVYVANSQMTRMLGCDSYNDFLSWSKGLIQTIIHPDDWARVCETVPCSLAEGAQYNIRYRVMRKDGTFFWMADIGRVVRAEDGRRAFLCVCRDVSENVRQETLLRQSEERFRIALQQVNAKFWEYDFATKRIYQSPAWCPGLKEARTIDNVPASLLKSGVVSPDTARDYEALYRRMEAGETQVCAQVRIRANDETGTYKWRKMAYTVVRDAQGVPVKAIGTAEDIHADHEKEARYRQLLREAHTDALTGLGDRAMLQEAAQKALCARRAGVTALLMLDIDNFKSINDQFGHVAGDQALCRVGKVLGEICPQQAEISRFGGDEFVILIPHADTRQDVCDLARALCTALREIKAEPHGDVCVTVSMGVAFASGREDTFSALYSAADAALYQVKCRGKNGYAVQDTGV